MPETQESSIHLRRRPRLWPGDPSRHLRPKPKRSRHLGPILRGLAIGAVLTGPALGYAAWSAQQRQPYVISIALSDPVAFISGAPTPWRIDGPADPAFPLVAIDAGHGGKDAGALADGIAEKNLTLALAFDLRERLLSTGRIRVVLTRAGDTFSAPAERASLLAGLKPAAVLSLHLDSYTDPRLSGPSTYILPAHQTTDADASARLAGAILAGLAPVATGPLQRPVQEPLAVLRVPGAASVLLETAYLTNPEDRARIASPATRATYADAIARALTGHLRDRDRIIPQSLPISTKMVCPVKDAC